MTIEPYDHGLLEVGDGHRVYWEVCGNPEGKPAVVVHGGPGSGAGQFWKKYFDLTKYKLVLFDQRNCGRSTPDAGDPEVDLSTNTTWHLIADMEQLREQLGIERWLVLGASWGATLGLAYAEQHPSAVSEIVLFSVTNTTRREVEWVTREMGRVFPAEWARFRDGVPEADRDGNLALAYSRLLHDPDPEVRDRAARNWCAWEDTHVATHGAGIQPDPRYDDPRFRLRFARLVSHYWGHAAWLEEGVLERKADKLAGIPGVLIVGRLDFSSPVEAAWKVAQRWPDAELTIVEHAGHGAGPAVAELVTDAIATFADR
ncbi:proline iminopeptidase [Kribbella flavida DSM 17836]|uniref:Proline iminopeptidase n=1 Tax=Kribbella flavida (strain DSM 17836 / JCM 10339 / NBRC 14399) TaxID=479435 RepID=D2Q3S7_KRIFD|nr:prolyl aminopeptidase [Kribbella flavida]ADB35949.1 proline iminopeptidase [Kribbella flavida DSM 17836]